MMAPLEITKRFERTCLPSPASIFSRTTAQQNKIDQG